MNDEPVTYAEMSSDCLRASQSYEAGATQRERKDPADPMVAHDRRAARTLALAAHLFDVAHKAGRVPLIQRTPEE